MKILFFVDQKLSPSELLYLACIWLAVVGRCEANQLLPSANLLVTEQVPKNHIFGQLKSGKNGF